MTWPLGSRFGSEKTPTSLVTFVSNPVSSRTSRITADSVASPSSTKPPGRAGMPRNGSLALRTATSFPSWRTSPSTATKGCGVGFIRSLERRHPDVVLFREADRVFVTRVRVPHHTHPRVRRQDAFDSPFRVFRAIADDERAGVGRIPDSDATAVVDCDQVRTGSRVEKGIQDG